MGSGVLMAGNLVFGPNKTFTITFTKPDGF
jgi:hypothetical protein